MCLHDVKNPLLEVVKQANLHCMEEVAVMEVAHDPGNISKHNESLVSMARQELGISSIGIGIAEHSI
jgi:hypothetical protein